MSLLLSIASTCILKRKGRYQKKKFKHNEYSIVDFTQGKIGTVICLIAKVPITDIH